MPNGGIPANLLVSLSPDKNWIAHCFQDEIRIYSREQWAMPPDSREPMITIASKDAQSLSGFVQYWAEYLGGEEPGGRLPPTPQHRTDHGEGVDWSWWY